MPGNAMAVSVRLRKNKARDYVGERAHDLRTSTPYYVDRRRSPWNSFIATPPPRDDLRAELERRWRQRGKNRGLRADAILAVTGIITFGHDLQPTIDTLARDEQDRRYQELAERIALELGTDVIGLVVHRDESAPHAHLTLSGYTPDGYSVAEKLTPARLRSMQDLAVTIYRDIGAERGFNKAARLAAGDDPADVINKSVRELHQQLPRELATARTSLDAVHAHVRELAAEREQLTADLNAARQELIDHEERAQRAQDRAARAEVERHTAETAAAEAAADAERQRGAVEKMAERAREATQRAERHQGRADELEAKIAAMEAHTARLERQIEDLTQDRDTQRRPLIPKPTHATFQRVQKRPWWFGGPYVEDVQATYYEPSTVQILAQKQERALLQAYDDKREAEHARDRAAAAYSALIGMLSLETPAGAVSAIDAEAQAMHAVSAPCSFRYGVIIREDECCISVPPQNAHDTQIAAALYRSCRERYGDTFLVWGLSDEAADAIASMAAEDGADVTVSDNASQDGRMQRAIADVPSAQGQQDLKRPPLDDDSADAPKMS